MATTDPAVTENNSLVVMRDGVLSTYIEQLDIALRARGYDLTYTMQLGNREQYQWSDNEYLVNLEGAPRYYERIVGYGTTLQISASDLASSMIGSGSIPPPTPIQSSPSIPDTTAVVPGSGVTPSTVSTAANESSVSSGTAGTTPVAGKLGLDKLTESLRAALVAGGYGPDTPGNVYEWNYWYQRCSEFKGNLPTFEQLKTIAPQLNTTLIYSADKESAMIQSWLAVGSGSGALPEGPGETPVPDSKLPEPPKDKSNKMLIGIGIAVVIAVLLWSK